MALVACGYLALEALEHDAVDKARPWLAYLANEPEGSTRHLRIAAEARIARLEHREREAYALTAPLVRKVVEPEARNVMLEEYARSALATRPMPEALDALDLWLTEGLVIDRRRAEALIDALLADLPDDGLARAYASMTIKERRARYSTRLLSIVQDRLEGSALLVDLEQSIRSTPRVRGYSIGVLVQTSTDEERARAAEFLRGLTWGVEHGPPAGRPNAWLYVKELSESRVAVCNAKAELEGAGVSVVALGPDGNLVSAWATCPGRRLPLLASSGLGRIEPAHNAEIAGYEAHFQALPTPLAGKGHDLASLAASVITSMPYVDTIDPEKIQAHDTAVTEALKATSVSTWLVP